LKEYPINNDIALLNDKVEAARKLRDLAVKLPFGYWKARKAAREATYFNRKFWQRIIDVYPELRNEDLAYRPHHQVVVIAEKEGD